MIFPIRSRRRLLLLVVLVALLAGCTGATAPARPSPDALDRDVALAVVDDYTEANNAAYGAADDALLARAESGAALRLDLADLAWYRAPTHHGEPFRPFRHVVEQVWISGRRTWPQWFVALGRTEILPTTTTTTTTSTTSDDARPRELLVVRKAGPGEPWLVDQFVWLSADEVALLPELTPDAEGRVPSVAGSGVEGGGPAALSTQWAQVLDGRGGTAAVTGEKALAAVRREEADVDDDRPMRWSHLPTRDRSYGLTTADGGELRLFTTERVATRRVERPDARIWLLGRWAALAGVKPKQSLETFSLKVVDMWVAYVPPPGAGPARVIGGNGNVYAVTATPRRPRPGGTG